MFAVCCSVLQCVAVRCSMWSPVAELKKFDAETSEFDLIYENTRTQGVVVHV